MADTVKVALLGLGTIGSGVYKLIERQQEEMSSKAGASIEIAAILVHNLGKEREGVDRTLLTDRWEDIINNEEIQIVIELMGGIEPARTMILEALKNGTTNYILTKMFEEGMDFDEALAQATELGYAEADPTADVEGLDAGRKIAILASIAFHSRIGFSDVYTEGITRITARDIAYARELGCVIKLLGIARNTPEGIETAVYPMLLPQHHPLASVRDSFNAIFVHGDAVDDAMFYGRGAGQLPTASAVMGDVIDVVRNLGYHCTGRINCTCYRDTPVKPFEQMKNLFFVRMQVENKPGVLAGIASIFGSHKVSISQVVQKIVAKGSAELVIVTEAVKEFHMQDALRHLEELETVREISSVIRQYGK